MARRPARGGTTTGKSKRRGLRAWRREHRAERNGLSGKARRLGSSEAGKLRSSEAGKLGSWEAEKKQKAWRIGQRTERLGSSEAGMPGGLEAHKKQKPYHIGHG